MKQEVAISKHSDTKRAVDELYGQLKHKDPALVIFLASTKYDFELASKELKNIFLTVKWLEQQPQVKL